MVRVMGAMSFVNSCVEFYAAVPLQMRSGTLAPVVRVDLSGTVQQPLPDVGGMVFHPQPQLWPAMPLAADCILPNNSGNQHEPLDIENGSESLSSAYSCRILSTLTEALQNNGVDMSQASISVQIDVGKHASFGASSTLSSKDHNNDRQCIPAVALGGEKSHG
ncbi:hypothetical protein SAY86_031169 [Trapa natans]|uniref:Uncharacterized protein n=1 Tax=Trapa natans TaxID=22666 RepID=A0AAN7RJD5_TRANT|nr:hypothetical protein SAY86_031169 [Trapa natans]